VSPREGYSRGDPFPESRKCRPEFLDYLFHLPSMVAALVLAYCFFSLLWEGRKAEIMLARWVHKTIGYRPVDSL